MKDQVHPKNVDSDVVRVGSEPCWFQVNETDIVEHAPRTKK